MFYDKRVNGYRGCHQQIKIKSQGPLYFGAEHSLRYPLRFFSSITPSVKGGDLPICTWNEFSSNFVQMHCFQKKLIVISTLPYVRHYLQQEGETFKEFDEYESFKNTYILFLLSLFVESKYINFFFFLN